MLADGTIVRCSRTENSELFSLVIGGYGLFALATKAGVPPLLCVPIVGVVAAIVSIPIARLLFRLRGAYFAISSWVVAEVFRLSAILITPLGGGSGMSLPARIAQSIGRAPHDRYVAVYLTTLGLLLAILVFAAHHENIRRLLRGEEPRIGQSKPA